MMELVEGKGVRGKTKPESLCVRVRGMCSYVDVSTLYAHAYIIYIPPQADPRHVDASKVEHSYYDIIYLV